MRAYRLERVFCETLPRSSAGRHIGEQLLRSATSVAANYAESQELLLRIGKRTNTALARTKDNTIGA